MTGTYSSSSYSGSVGARAARLPTSTHLANGHGNKHSDKNFASRHASGTTKNVTIDRRWNEGGRRAKKSPLKRTEEKSKEEPSLNTSGARGNLQRMPFFDAYFSPEKCVSGPIPR